MTNLFTIGYEGAQLADFIRSLISSGSTLWSMSASYLCRGVKDFLRRHLPPRLRNTVSVTFTIDGSGRRSQFGIVCVRPATT